MDKEQQIKKLTNLEESVIRMAEELVKLKDERAELENKIECLKAKNECFTENMKYVLEIEKKTAVREFAEKVKAKSYVNDYCREVVEIEKIDELLKDNEK